MAIKLTKRKAFNFLRSYFDVVNDIPEDSDKLAFLMSIINKQFLNEDPEDLNFITNLCYNSQRHSVEKSVKGWEIANKTTLPCGMTPPPTLPTKGDPALPPKEEEEKEQEEEQEKGEDEVKKANDIYLPVEVLKQQYLKNDRICEAVISNPKNNIKDLVHLENRLNEFVLSLQEVGRSQEILSEFTKYFRNWNKKVPAKESKPTTKQEYEQSLKSKIKF